MKAFFLLLISLMLTSISPPLEAQQETRYSLPEVPTIVRDGDKIICTRDGVEYDCIKDKTEYKLLTFGQWQTVLLLANAYKGLYDWRLETQGVLAVHTDVENYYEDLIKGKDQIIKNYKQDIEYLTFRLKQENQKSNKSEFNTKLERSVLWGIILAETVTMFVVGVKGASATF